MVTPFITYCSVYFSKLSFKKYTYPIIYCFEKIKNHIAYGNRIRIRLKSTFLLLFARALFVMLLSVLRQPNLPKLPAFPSLPQPKLHTCTNVIREIPDKWTLLLSSSLLLNLKRLQDMQRKPHQGVENLGQLALGFTQWKLGIRGIFQGLFTFRLYRSLESFLQFLSIFDSIMYERVHMTQ